MNAAREADRAPVEHFERLAREREDPWDYATSEYEQAKYRRTLAALPAETGRTLELGCSVGVFTALLAPRCSELVAVDFSPTALARARERVAGFDHVEVRQARLPEEMPRGPFATVVCSEILYYWSADLVREGLRRIENEIAPGGSFVAVHWRPRDRRRELDGVEVHEILREWARLRRLGGETHDSYLLDTWRNDG